MWLAPASGEDAPQVVLGVARLVAGQAPQVGECPRGDAEQALARRAGFYGGDLVELLAKLERRGLGVHDEGSLWPVMTGSFPTGAVP